MKENSFKVLSVTFLLVGLFLSIESSAEGDHSFSAQPQPQTATGPATFKLTGQDAADLIALLEQGGASQRTHGDILKVSVSDVRCTAGYFLPLHATQSCGMKDDFKRRGKVDAKADTALKIFRLLEKAGIKKTQVPDAAWVEASQIACMGSLEASDEPTTCTIVGNQENVADESEKNPNCWGQPETYFEGKYSIVITRSQAPPDVVDTVLNEVNRGYLRADGKPLNFGNLGASFISTTAAAPPNVRITKAGLKKQAERQLAKVASLPGVRISCSPIYRTAVGSR